MKDRCSVCSVCVAALLPVTAVVFMRRRLSAWLCGKELGWERLKEGGMVGRNGTLVELIQK